MVTCTGHIGIHEGADGRTDVDDVMDIKPNFLTSMGYHIFLTMVPARARSSATRFLHHMNHVSVSPTNGNGPTQGQRKTLTRVGNKPTTFGLDHRCSTD